MIIQSSQILNTESVQNQNKQAILRVILKQIHLNKYLLIKELVEINKKFHKEALYIIQELTEITTNFNKEAKSPAIELQDIELINNIITKLHQQTIEQQKEYTKSYRTIQKKYNQAQTTEKDKIDTYMQILDHFEEETSEPIRLDLNTYTQILTPINQEKLELIKKIEQIRATFNKHQKLIITKTHNQLSLILQEQQIDEEIRTKIQQLNIDMQKQNNNETSDIKHLIVLKRYYYSLAIQSTSKRR